MVDMKIFSNLKPLGAALNVQKINPAQEAGQPFGSVLSESLKAVNNLQLKADNAIENMITGKNTNIHETMIAISKADLAFRMTMQIRNKVMDAYQEVMRTSL